MYGRFGSGEHLRNAFGKYNTSVAPFKPRHQVDLTRRSICDTPRDPDVIGVAKFALGVVPWKLIDGKYKLLLRAVIGIARFTPERQYGQCAVDLNRFRAVLKVKEDASTKTTDGGQPRLVQRRVRPDNEDAVRQRQRFRVGF